GFHARARGGCSLESVDAVRAMVAQQPPAHGDDRAVRQLDYWELTERRHGRPPCGPAGPLPFTPQCRLVLIEGSRDESPQPVPDFGGEADVGEVGAPVDADL